MKKVIFLIITILLAQAADHDRIPLLRWAGPEGTYPETYEEWIAQNPYSEFQHCLQNIYYGDGRQGTVAIITENSIYSALTSELAQLCTNMQSEGYTIQSHTMTGGTPEILKTLLLDLYSMNGIEGALLIGSLPVAWFEIDDDFGTYGYADFPCDLFFMDLNGTWLDTMSTGNGKYDGHTGSITPEIYVGRLYPSGLGDDTLLLKNYFIKNNAYRHDTLLLTQRALVFVDDDWIPWAGWWAENVSLLYSDTMNYWDADTTRASVYRQKLDTVQAWVSVFAHSSPQMHQFTFNNGSSYDFYYSTEYTSQDPPANFYNFFACSFSRFTASGNCGGSRAIFNQNHGIGSIGSTKTGSMLDFEYFYDPLGQGENLGCAFKDWFTYITGNGVTFDELCWHYGMSLLADCYLKPTGHSYAVAEQTDNAITSKFLHISCNVIHDQINAIISVPTNGSVSLALFNTAGQQVRHETYQLSSGTHSITIDLCEHNGTALPSGIYLLHATSGIKSVTKKIIKI